MGMKTPPPLNAKIKNKKIISEHKSCNEHKSVIYKIKYQKTSSINSLSNLISKKKVISSHAKSFWLHVMIYHEKMEEHLKTR